MLTAAKHASLSQCQDIKSIDPLHLQDGDYTYIFIQLFSVFQKMCGQTKGVVEQLCQEIVTVTNGLAQLHLYAEQESNCCVVARSVSISFPVYFQGIIYGTLEVMPDENRPGYPAMPLPTMHLLAQVCACILYTSQMAMLLGRDGTQLGQVSSSSFSLTRRAREVLTLMCQGYDQKRIAEKLCITLSTVRKHCQYIYQELGVHCERDAIFMAYRLGLSFVQNAEEWM